MKVYTNVSYGDARLEVLEGGYTKEDLEKPWVEPDYYLFDCRVTLFGKDVGIFEVEVDKLRQRLKLQKYTTTGRKEIVGYWELKNIEYLNKEIKQSLKVYVENFNFMALIEFAIDKLEENQKTQKKSLFLYEPFILEGSTSILVSPMGVGKTLFAIWLAYRIQNGLPLLIGEANILNNESPAKKVCYLAFEGTYVELEEKIKSIKKVYLEREKVLFNLKEIKDFYYEFFAYPLYANSVRKQIRKIISVIKPDLIIIDSITSALLSKDELRQSDYIFSYIKSIFEPRNIATLLLMHPSKQDLKEGEKRPKGSILYLAYPRIVWYITQTLEYSHGFQIHIQSIKDNLGLKKKSYKFDILFKPILEEEKETETETEDEDLRYKIDINLVEIIDEEIQSVKVADKCIEYLERNEKATISEISQYYKINYETVRKTLSRLTEAGKVIKLGRGVYALNKNLNKEKHFVIENENEIPF